MTILIVDDHPIVRKGIHPRREHHDNRPRPQRRERSDAHKARAQHPAQPSNRHLHHARGAVVGVPDGRHRHRGGGDEERQRQRAGQGGEAPQRGQRPLQPHIRTSAQRAEASAQPLVGTRATGHRPHGKGALYLRHGSAARHQRQHRRVSPPTHHAETQRCQCCRDDKTRHRAWVENKHLTNKKISFRYGKP